MKTFANESETVADFVKERHDLYVPGTEPELIDVPGMQFLMIDGQGMPEGPGANEFQAAMGALYGLVYSLKMSPKKNDAPEGYHNFKVPPPEGLWWVVNGRNFANAKPDDWRWTLMIRVPDWVTPAAVQHFTKLLVDKKKSEVYRQVRLQTLHEGPSVQLMHIGSYDSETANIDKMRTYIAEQGYRPQGKHHEIYFGDPRRTAPAKLHTVLRQPIAL